QARVQRQEPSVDVRDDQAGQPSPQITVTKGVRKGRACPAFLFSGTEPELRKLRVAAVRALSPNYLWYEVTRSTSFFDPRITATRWCSALGCRSRMRVAPSVAAPPACSSMQDIGFASYMRRKR